MLGAPRVAIGLLSNFLPWRWKRFVYRNILRYAVDDSAYVGFSIILVRHLSMGGGSRIGHFNLVRGCDSLLLQASSTIGHLNVVTAVPSSRHDGAGAPMEHGILLLVHEGTDVGNRQVIESHGEGRDWLCCIR